MSQIGVKTCLPPPNSEPSPGGPLQPGGCEPLSQRPAELYGLVGKGRLQVGWDGDLTVVDLDTMVPVRNLAACSSFTDPHSTIQDV